MSLTIVGVGLGRTGTTSLQEALGVILNGPVFHMGEVFANLDSVPTWHAAVDGKPTDWDSLLAGYRATLDWAGGHVLARHRSGQPGGSRTAVHPL